MEKRISIVIRTMIGRELYLDRCLFLLSGQTYSFVEPVVVVQKRNESEDTSGIEKVVARWGECFPCIQIHTHTANFDARAKSLNVGKLRATGRYLAFLDDDDKPYPPHYQTLIKALQKTDYSWAYSDIVRALYNEYGQLIERTHPFKREGYSFLDHLRGNFMPIHSFVIDRERAGPLEDVEETLNRNEDYDFLLRLAFQHEPLYVPYFGAEYCIRSDGSNTVSDGTARAREALAKRRLWNAAQDVLDSRKIDHFGWWVRELDQFPLIYPRKSYGSDEPPRSECYRKLLADYHATRSWKMTRPLRNLVRRVRGQPLEILTIPNSEEMAQVEIHRLLTSTSWELTAPLRIVRKLIRNAA